jgi:hypothetical protein
MDFKSLPRCGAKAKSNFGLPCRHVAMKNGRCYYHGGSTPIKHGRYTKAAAAKRTQQRSLINEMRQASAALSDLVNACTCKNSVA